MSSKKYPSIVTIADSNFVIAVFLLLASLRKFRIKARIYVLGVNLTEAEVAVLNQFDDVKVCPADLTNERNPATRKGEALLLAEHDDSDYVTLLDGDCLATGDITSYLTPEGKGLFVRIRTPEEEGRVFATRYREGDTYGGIPGYILERWRSDVGERQTAAINNTVLGGNLTLSKDYIGFARRWQQQIESILPRKKTREAHDPSSEAYSQLDESILNSLLAFSDVVPPIHSGAFDADANAYIAHLGPNNPKPWILWRRDTFRYFDLVVDVVEWVEQQGLMLPPIPWTFKRKNKPQAYLLANAYYFYRAARRWVGRPARAAIVKHRHTASHAD